MSHSPTDLCVLADTHLLPWQVEALERTVEQTDTRISLVIVDDPSYENKESERHRPAVRTAIARGESLGLADVSALFQSLRAEGAWTLVLAERKVAWLLGYDESDWLERIPVQEVDVLNDAVRIHCTPNSDGVWNELPDELVELVANESDVAVRFGFGLLRGDVLDAPEYGVLSFHAADVRRYRGLGPDLVFYNGDDTAGSTLQQLTEEIDAGQIIAIDTIDVSDARTSDEVRRRTYDLQQEMLARGINRLRDPGFEPRELTELAEYTSHRTRQKVTYSLPIAARNLVGRLREHSPTYRRLRRFVERRVGSGDDRDQPDADRNRVQSTETTD